MDLVDIFESITRESEVEILPEGETRAIQVPEEFKEALEFLSADVRETLAKEAARFE
jgi:hypothetical protein